MRIRKAQVPTSNAGPAPTSAGNEPRAWPTDAQEAEAARQMVVGRDYIIAAALSGVVGKQLLSTLAARKLLDNILDKNGKPSDPVERLLTEQYYLSYHVLLQLAERANKASTAELTGTLYAAYARLLGEFRRHALALKELRRQPNQRALPARPDVGIGAVPNDRDHSAGATLGRIGLPFEVTGLGDDEGGAAA